MLSHEGTNESVSRVVQERIYLRPLTSEAAAKISVSLLFLKNCSSFFKQVTYCATKDSPIFESSATRGSLEGEPGKSPTGQFSDRANLRLRAFLRLDYSVIKLTIVCRLAVLVNEGSNGRKQS